jgi:hypothetical protein
MTVGYLSVSGRLLRLAGIERLGRLAMMLGR